MADVGFNPQQTRHDRVKGGVTTVTGVKYGSVLIKDVAAAGTARAVKTTTTPGDGPVAGVCVSQMDPAAGSAVGDELEYCDSGTVEVLLAASQTIVKGDKLVTSATAGAVKKLAAETGSQILVGTSNMDCTSAAATNPLISADLNGSPFETV